uniref:Transposase MuDR plant domain-containing protein n=1 Tax=Brassica campestris TaxID=3711 RepID=M4E9L7_BRACM
METRKISVFCYWNGCIKDGPFYEGSTPRVIRVESRTDLPTLLSDLHRVTEFEKGKFQMDVIGRYPSVVQQPMVKSMRLPIVDDSSLETMLETRKRSRQNDADESANVRNPRENNNNGWLEEENSTDDVNCGNNEAAQKDSKKKKPDLTKELSNSVSKQYILSSSWLTERELYVGMLFRDQEELKKAVKLYSERRQRDYDVYDYSSKIHFRCTKICGWDLKAAKTNGNGFEITEYRGVHTCKPANVGSDFLAGEIECLIKEISLLNMS